MSIREVGSYRRASLALVLGCLAFFLLFYNGRLGIIDGEFMFETTQSIVDRGSLAISPHPFASRGKDGRYYSKYGPMQSICAIPLYVVGRTAAAHISASYQAMVERAAVALLNPMVMSLLALAVFRFGLDLGYSARRALAAALLTVTGTSLFYLTKTFNSEPLTALFLLLSFHQLYRYRGERRNSALVLAGVLLGCCIATRQVAGLAIPLFAVYLWGIGARKLDQLARFVAPIAVTLAALAVYNYARFGHPLRSGYADEGFSTPIFYGLAGLLFSPRCGLVFYCPVVLFAFAGARRLWGTHRSELLLAGILSFAWLLSAAGWWCWWGGWAVGPRLFLPVVPILVLIAVAAIPSARQVTGLRAGLMLLLVTVNFGVQVVPLLVAHPEWRQIEQQITHEPEAGFWSFRYMPLWWQARNLRTVLLGVPSGAPASAEAPTATDEAVNSRFNVPVIDAWSSYLRVMGVNPAVPFLGIAILVLGALLAALDLRRTLLRWPAPDGPQAVCFAP